MSHKNISYSVLIVSENKNLNTTLNTLLDDKIYSTKHFAKGLNEARTMLSKKHYDFVIINAPSELTPALRFTLSIFNEKESIILLLVKANDYKAIYERTAEHGIFLLAKPLSKQTLFTALSCMISARERIRSLEQEVHSAEEKAKELVLTNRAKWLLITKLSMSEEQAHRYIEKQAMDRCVSRKNISQEIITNYSK